jgi:diphthamide synthase (EF-2-diphthine--ammonia ligase)
MAVDGGLEIIMEKHSETARELLERLDKRNDDQSIEILGELIEYQTMLVTFLCDVLRRKIEYADAQKS